MEGILGFLPVRYISLQTVININCLIMVCTIPGKTAIGIERDSRHPMATTIPIPMPTPVG